VGWDSVKVVAVQRRRPFSWMVEAPAVDLVCSYPTNCPCSAGSDLRHSVVVVEVPSSLYPFSPPPQLQMPSSAPNSS